MAIDKKLQIFDDEGNPVDYDILASDVKFLPDGKDLPTKLAEMEEEIGQGGYTPPASGIPKTDLAPSVQTSLGLADTALQAADKAQLQAAITSLQNALNALIGSGNVQGAIDTFNEVTAFLNGIDTSDPTLKNQLLALSNAITALQTALNTKANSTEVVKSISVNGTAQTKDTNGNVNVSVPTLTLDDAPTAGSNNAVKSGGIKTAIDQVTPTIDANGKWVIGGVTTDKDAQGPRGNTVLVNENAVGIQGLIVNNLTEGGEDEILSAEMGKVIRQNIMKIFNALGTYAFPEGKPILNWGSTVINHSINTNGVTGGLTISDVEVDGVSAASLPAQIADGKSLSFKLNLPSNIYIYDAVAITMGGVDITDTTGVWDESTGEVNIAAVTDNVVITATALTYVGYGEQNSPLVFMLDCKNRGGQSGHWIDLIGNKDFTLNQVQESDSGMVFDGVNSTALHSGSLAVGYETGTIEFVIEPTNGITTKSTILFNGYEEGIIAAGNTDPEGTFKGISTAYSGTTAKDKLCVELTGFPAAASLNINNKGNRAALVDGVVGNSEISNLYFGVRAVRTGKMTVGCFINDTTGAALPVEAITIKAIRVYSSQLTLAQAQQNYKIDKKRFNLQ